MPSSQQAQIQAEVVQLHEFFVDWFNGTCEHSEAYFDTHFVSRFDDEYQMVMPNGVLFTRATMFPEMYNAYGSSQFKIQVRKIEARDVGADLSIATYEEWQKGALNSEPSNNGRVSSGLFRTDASAPNGVRWVHLQETWLPAEVMAADTFDF